VIIFLGLLELKGGKDEEEFFPNDIDLLHPFGGSPWHFSVFSHKRSEAEMGGLESRRCHQDRTCENQSSPPYPGREDGDASLEWKA
jgi:hypothetical protein